MNSSIIDKQFFVSFTEIKHLSPYFLKSKTKVIAPYKTIRNVLVEKELSEKRAHTMKTVKQYEYDIKHEQIVRGQGLCKWVINFFLIHLIMIPI